MSALWYDTTADGQEDACWELYHENSKLERRARFAADRAQAVDRGPPDREFEALPAFSLGDPGPGGNALDAAAAEPLRPGWVPLAVLATLTACNKNRRGPVELYFAAANVVDLPAGLYRHEPERRIARLLRRGDFSKQIAGMVREPGITADAAVLLFTVGDFGHVTQTEGERGYRRALMAAGALAHELQLTAAACGCGHAGGEFFDREIDALFGLDGLSRSALAMVAVGAPAG